MIPPIIAPAIPPATVTIDRTKPQAPTVLSPTGVQSVNTQNFTSTVDGGTTTSCILRFPQRNPGSRDNSMSHTGNTCSLQISNMAKTSYQYIIIASDGLNSTTSATVTLDLDGTGSSKRKAIVVGALLGGGVSEEHRRYIQKICRTRNMEV